jgi:phenylacetate-CoA ligase
VADGVSYIPAEQALHRGEIARVQREKLGAMLGEVLKTNPFYRAKLGDTGFDPSRDPIEKLAFTTRAEIESDQAAHPPYGTNLTYPRDRYVRFHQTSGSGGKPVRWLDTVQSWEWWKRLWGVIFTAGGVTPGGSRIMFPFSFGPFVGFWAAFEGSVAMGNLSLPAGGMTTSARLKMLVDNDIDVVCCTPTYALRMAEVAKEEGIDLAGAKVSRLFVAGEPGGSIPEVRRKVEQAWGARVFDHTGMTEMGAVSFECTEAPLGVHVNEMEFIAEVIDPATGQPAPDGQVGELVLTNLGRWGSPLIRYRTGDQVRMTREKCKCGRWFGRLEGGILGRLDDMFTVRGNNVFPTALEGVIRRFPEIAEFRVEVSNGDALTEIRVDVEPVASADGPALARRVAGAIQDSLNFRARVSAVACGTLPRYEMKSKRFVKEAQKREASSE